MKHFVLKVAELESSSRCFCSLWKWQAIWIWFLLPCCLVGCRAVEGAWLLAGRGGFPRWLSPLAKHRRLGKRSVPRESPKGETGQLNYEKIPVVCVKLKTSVQPAELRWKNVARLRVRLWPSRLGGGERCAFPSRFAGSWLQVAHNPALSCTLALPNSWIVRFRATKIPPHITQCEAFIDHLVYQ